MRVTRIGASRALAFSLLVLATAWPATARPQAPRTPPAARGTAPLQLATPATPARGWTAVRAAKWTLLGVAAGFGLYALTHSSRADRAYGELRTLCADDPSGCTLSEGRYAGARAEALYRGSLREDRRAQVGIVAGQVTLLGSVALFVYDLRNGRGPENIPFPGAGLRLTPSGHRVAVGARLRF
jgi:hypothetical protein